MGQSSPAYRRILLKLSGEALLGSQDYGIDPVVIRRIVAEIAGTEVVKKHIDGPQGVRGRNSDNSRLREVLGWEPQISLEEGLRRTYAWIEPLVAAKLGVTIAAVEPAN